MHRVIKKAVELGVAAVQPLAAQRCVVWLAGERAEKRNAHWQGVIVAAFEQSGHNLLAQLDSFAGYIGQNEMHKRILLSPRAEQSLTHWSRQQPPQALTIRIGPEGGNAKQEEDAAIARGAIARSVRACCAPTRPASSQWQR